MNSVISVDVRRSAEEFTKTSKVNIETTFQKHSDAEDETILSSSFTLCNYIFLKATRKIIYKNKVTEYGN